MLKAFDASLALSSFAAGPTFTVADAMMLHSLQADIVSPPRPRAAQLPAMSRSLSVPPGMHSALGGVPRCPPQL